MKKKKWIIIIVAIIIFLSLGGVSFKVFIYDAIFNSDSQKLHFSNEGWQYDKKNKVYYKLGINYVKEELSIYEKFNIYVPENYLKCTQVKDGSYECEVNEDGTVGNYNASNAPIIMPVTSMGYVAQKIPESYIYSNVSKFLPKGFIYVYSGFRGRNNDGDVTGGAPWGVTDLKAMIRYLKLNDKEMAGDAESIFLYGHSSGGTLASVVASSGDSDLYKPYLEKLGAAMYDANDNSLSDSIRGVMVWCPTITEFANEAYEWNMGQYSFTKTRFKNNWTSVLSEDLAKAYATYINDIKLKDENGQVLLLSKTDDGIFNSGTYYYYLKSVIETSLLNYLKENYKTVEDMQKYVKRFSWASFDSENMTVTIADIGSFIKEMKMPDKSVPAFDYFNKTRAENALYGVEKEDSLHWDNTLYNIIKTNDDSYKLFSDYQSYVEDFAKDLAMNDALGNNSQTRQNMYNPLYYLIEYYDGFKSSKVAPNWRIRSGIKQTDTALTTEVNLALALKNYGNVNVDFETIWNKAHTQAEASGDAIGNFIEWVENVMKEG